MERAVRQKLAPSSRESPGAIAKQKPERRDHDVDKGKRWTPGTWRPAPRRHGGRYSADREARRAKTLPRTIAPTVASRTRRHHLCGQLGAENISLGCGGLANLTTAPLFVERDSAPA